jgi:hypothetical protein
MKMRLDGIVLNERPKFLTTHPADLEHSIVLEESTISLDIFNVAYLFHGRTPKKGKNMMSAKGLN